MKVTTGNHYLAFVLDEATRERIISKYFPTHEVFKCHHVTIAYDFTEEDIPRLQALVDSNPRFETDSFLTSEVVNLFTVLVNRQFLKTDSGESHLTHSHRADAQASDSNKVMKWIIPTSSVRLIKMKLFGHFELIEKKKQPSEETT